MGALRDFVSEVLEMEGSAVEAVEPDGLEALAPEPLRKVMGWPELVRLGFGAELPAGATAVGFEGDWLEDGQLVVSIANSDVTNKRSEVDRRTYERAGAVIINDWESVIDNDQTELLEPLERGVIRKDQIHELGDLLIGKTRIAPPAGGEGIVYYKNNSGLAIQFAVAGGILYRRAIAEGNNKTIPTEWLGSDLSAYYKAGFRPSP